MSKLSRGDARSIVTERAIHSMKFETWIKLSLQDYECNILNLFPNNFSYVVKCQHSFEKYSYIEETMQ